MKLIHFLALGLMLCSCRGDSLSDLQRIDQIINIYIKDGYGKDLLNSSDTGTFHSVVFKDIGGLTDQTTISGSWVKTDASSVKYLQYISKQSAYANYCAYSSTGRREFQYSLRKFVKIVKIWVFRPS